MFVAALFLAVVFLAYSNGANDNFKGVASLFGSGTTSYGKAVSWAAITTFAGSVAAIFLAPGLLQSFSGKGLVPDSLTASPGFLLAVAIGAGATVIIATLAGFPVSTTHGLTGALVGAGLVATGGRINFPVLGRAFVLPLVFSPVLALVAGAGIHLALRLFRRRSGLTREMCVCAGTEQTIAPLTRPGGVLSAQARTSVTLRVDEPALCTGRYTGTFWGVGAGQVMDALHFLSAGAVSFARGLNDTPKIAALLLVTAALNIRPACVTVAVAMALGGMLGARRVAGTMAHKITRMNPEQGFSANLATALLVTTAGVHGLPVSTTHVSVGALLGVGVVTRQARWKPVAGIFLSWVATLPCAALVAALAYLAMHWPTQS